MRATRASFFVFSLKNLYEKPFALTKRAAFLREKILNFPEKERIAKNLKNFSKKIKKVEKSVAKQLDLNFFSYYNK